MTAKEYLQQIANMECKINILRLELEDLKEKALSIGGSGFGERVQTSPTGDALERKVAKIIDKENELSDYILKAVNIRNKIVLQITGLKDTRYMQILHMHYVPEHGRLKRLEDIACIMKKKNGDCYSYDHIVDLHGEALQVFQKKYLNPIETPCK